MSQSDSSVIKLLDSLNERAKELACLYQIEEILRDTNAPLSEIFQRVCDVLPPGWRYPESCQARITHESASYSTPNYAETEWTRSAYIVAQGAIIGRVEVSYREKMAEQDDGPFLKEERKLLNTVAERLGHYIFHRQLMPVFKELEAANDAVTKSKRQYWRTILDMLRISDKALFQLVSRRMLNYLYYIGVEEAKRLLGRLGGLALEMGDRGDAEGHEGLNRPFKKRSLRITADVSEEIFEIASRSLSDDLIYSSVQKWIKENKVSFLIDVLEDHSTSLSDIADAITRYKHSDVKESDLSVSTMNAVKVSLIRRFLSRRLEFINFGKQYVGIDDFAALSSHIVYPLNSNGKLGGKSTGLFLAMQILRQAAPQRPELADVKAPKAWYIASDGLMDFINYNHLEELLEYKYRDIDQIRMEYPNIVMLFKNSSFSPEMVKGIAMALDDFGDRPLIVRSSSLLEDSLGAAFSGKYKSLFIANQGTKKQRLEALLDAIAEVYASMFNPDPIQYRSERGLLDYQDEMAILIQEVVGSRAGDYLLPTYAGVAFSYNEFRWSQRIKREDGLARLVPGLGTRAVDRLGDDYPALIAPGQPHLRVNAGVEEVITYAPKYIDAINIKKNCIETIKIEDFLKECGGEFKGLQDVFSIIRDGMTRPCGVYVDFEKDFLVATFDGLVRGGGFVKKINALLEVLSKAYNSPIDVEFACDGENFYLLQCRPQSGAGEKISVELPKNLSADRVLFSANKYVSDGSLRDVTHIVYVVPENYDDLESAYELKAVARAVGRLNNALPKRQFILMGPGRWGSRGDVKLGVQVGYSDINNTAALVEMAFRKGNYTPDLSFGTHFFQDLVEASIRYLPLYPDDSGVVFNRAFFENSPSVLADLLPEFAEFSKVIRVIDVAAATGGLALQVYANGDEQKAYGFLSEPLGAAAAAEDKTSQAPIAKLSKFEPKETKQDEHWRWRLRMAEKVAASIDPRKYGVKGMYLFGSVKNATAGAGSDIDVIVHFEGNEAQRETLENYLEGWSASLGEANYLKTGFSSKGLLDVHIVTDEDIARRDSYAIKISAVSDPAKPLEMKKTT